MSRGVKEKKHYENILMLSRSGRKLAVLNERKCRFYIERGLGEYKRYPKMHKEYEKVLRLNFNPNIKDDIRECEILENKCVVCGSTKRLSLHHVVPRCIRRWLDVDLKGNAHHWCVLLCEKEHDRADLLAQELYQKSLDHVNYLIREATRQMRKNWAKDLIEDLGGPEKVNQAFGEQFMKLKPKHLPKGFLKDK